MGFKGDQSRMREAWERKFAHFKWPYARMKENESDDFEVSWASLFARDGEADRLLHAMHKGYGRWAIDLLRHPAGVGLETEVEKIISPPPRGPVAMDIVNVAMSLGWHLVCGGVTLGRLVPGEDATIALIAGKKRVGILWPHGERNEAFVIIR